MYLFKKNKKIYRENWENTGFAKISMYRKRDFSPSLSCLLGEGEGEAVGKKDNGDGMDFGGGEGVAEGRRGRRQSNLHERGYSNEEGFNKE